jgi:hypothetical protein
LAETEGAQRAIERIKEEIADSTRKLSRVQYAEVLEEIQTEVGSYLDAVKSEIKRDEKAEKEDPADEEEDDPDEDEEE